MYKSHLKIKRDEDEGSFIYRCDKCDCLFRTKSLVIIHILAADHHDDTNNSAGWTAVPDPTKPKPVTNKKAPDLVDLTENDDNSEVQQLKDNNLQEIQQNGETNANEMPDLVDLTENGDSDNVQQLKDDKLQDDENNVVNLTHGKLPEDFAEAEVTDYENDVGKIKRSKLSDVTEVTENNVDKVTHDELSSHASAEDNAPPETFANSLFVPVKMNTEFQFEFEDVNILEEGESQPAILQNHESSQTPREEPVVIVATKQSFSTHPVNEPDKDVTQRYFCKGCGKGFTIRFIFEGHIKTCSGATSDQANARPMPGQADANASGKYFKVCPICRNSFHSYSSWIKHQSNACYPPYEGSTMCPIPWCRKEYRTLYFLRTHMQTVHSHVGDNEIQCAVCGEKFNLRSDFYVHLGRKHGEDKRIRRSLKR